MGSTQIIVSSRLDKTGIRRKYRRSYPNRVITKMVLFPTYKGRRGVGINYRIRR